METLYYIITFYAVWRSGCAQTNPCRTGWEQHGNSCYLFVNTQATWTESFVQCSVFGGYLAEVNSAEENTYLNQAIRNHHYGINFWLGGLDAEVEGNWRWATAKTDITFFDWAPNEPNESGGNEDCIEIRNDFHWNDATCRDLKGFICEQLLTESAFG